MQPKLFQDNWISKIQCSCQAKYICCIIKANSKSWKKWVAKPSIFAVSLKQIQRIEKNEKYFHRSRHGLHESAWVIHSIPSMSFEGFTFTFSYAFVVHPHWQMKCRYKVLIVSHSMRLITFILFSPQTIWNFSSRIPTFLPIITTDFSSD